jgi:hypothetical protein
MEHKLGCELSEPYHTQDLEIPGEWNATSAPKNPGGSCASRNRDKGNHPTSGWGSFLAAPALSHLGRELSKH